MNEIRSVTKIVHIIQTQIDDIFKNRRKSRKKITPASTGRFRTVASTPVKI